jgi:hypothetical protein
VVLVTKNDIALAGWFASVALSGSSSLSEHAGREQTATAQAKIARLLRAKVSIDRVNFDILELLDKQGTGTY